MSLSADRGTREQNEGWLELSLPRPWHKLPNCSRLTGSAKKMQYYGPQASCLVYLLLLLLLSTLFIAVQSFLYPRSGQKPYLEDSARFFSHEVRKARQTGVDEEDPLQYCDGDFDIYFIFDK